MATSWGNAMEAAVAWTPVLADAAAKGVVVMAVAAGAACAMRRASAAARHLAWGLALGGLLVLPVLSAALPAWRVLPAWAEMGRVTEAATAQAPVAAKRAEDIPARMPAAAKNANARDGQRVAVRTARAIQGAAPAAARAMVQPARRLSAAEIAAMVLLAWAAGAIVATLPVLAGAFAIWRVRRGSRRIADAEWAAALREAKGRLGLKRSVMLLESPRQAMPMVWGVFRTKLLVPAEAQGWTDGRRRVVLLHELAHAKRWDCLTRLAARVACAAHWFNPLAWLGYRFLQAESERACDDLVLAAGSRPADYAGHILAIVSRAKGRTAEVHAAIAMARRSNLEGRLRAILDEGRSRRALTRMAIAAAAVVLAAVVVPLSMMKTAAGEAKKAGSEAKAAVTADAPKPDASGVSSGAGGGQEAPKDDGLSLDEIAPEVVRRVSRATLANGVWVEFVAVTKSDSGSRDGKWWMPNGDAIGRKLYDWMGVTDPSGESYDFVIRRGGTPCVQTQWRVGDDVRVNDFGVHPMLGGRDVADLTSTCFRLDEGSQTATLYYGAAAGAWRQELTWGSFGAYPDGAGGTISALGTDTDKGLFVVVSHSRLADATRVTATDRAGAVHVPQEGPRLVRQGMVSYEMTFAGLKKQDVRSLAFETCPFEWTRWDNVSLAPGQMTQLTASMEAPGDIGAAPTEAAAEEGIPPTQSETAEAPQAAEEAPAPEVQILTTEWGRRIPGGGAPNKVAVVQGCRIDIGAAAGMDFVLISAGTFEMGSSDGEDQERPQHGVTITKPFYLGKYEVTQAQWAAVMGDNPSFFKGDNMPVDSVSWNDCQEFLKRLNEMAPGHDFRLPTEAEREYACRAGTTTKYWFGGDEVPLEPYAWTDTTSENRPHPVGLLQPNPWGLYDMHGNVWEWCSDWHRGDYYSMSPTEDPRGPSAGEKKVMRGGSWSNPGPYSRSAKRGYYDPTARSNNTGLRVASTAQESAAEAPSVPRPNEALLSKESEIEIGSTARMDFVLIRSGAFEMGSVDGESDEQPVHKVEITVPFYLGKYEVTQAQWVAVMDSNPSVFKGDDLPVDSVTWYDCQEFLKRLNEMAPGHNFRLPTEAEREYACRAGTTMRYSFGDSEDGIERFAWVDTTSGNQPHPVGQLQPNPWGLYDMHGNVWEWCSDWHRGDYYAMSPLEDPQGPDSQDPIVVQGASKKVLRGGSWSNPGPYSRSANRGYYDPNAKHNNYGLRVAWTAE